MASGTEGCDGRALRPIFARRYVNKTGFVALGVSKPVSRSISLRSMSRETGRHLIYPAPMARVRSN